MNVINIMLIALIGALICFIFLLCKLIRMPGEEKNIYEAEIQKNKKNEKTISE